MTKARSYLGDNGGRCESCDRPESAKESQVAYPVMLGGGLGLGTMWLCPSCLKEQQERASKTKHPTVR